MFWPSDSQERSQGHKNGREEVKSEMITEGAVQIWQHEYSKNGDVKQEAFYNPV